MNNATAYIIPNPNFQETHSSSIYEITNENDMTKTTMIGEYGQYVKYFVNMIKEVTGLEFPQIEKKLEI